MNAFNHHHIPSSTFGGRIVRWLARLVVALPLTTTLMACASGKDEGIGTGITGIDHLPDHLSVQNFWVNGYRAAQAGKGGSNVCCATLPRKWRSELKVQIRWSVADWQAGTWTCYVREVPVEPYEEVGQLWVHFLSDGSVRVVSSIEGPRSPTYPGPRDLIPPKHPWDQYSPPPADLDCHRRAELNK